ncbi:MAG: oligoendopeptidase F [Xanthomonadales bacterium]|nr:oligoendopeptidase F [Xanthomonadales bacterium]
MKRIIMLLVAVSLAATSLAQDEKDTWNLADLYPSVDAWNKAKDALAADLARIDHCQGQLGVSATKLLECSEMLSEMAKAYGRISSYAGMASDADTRDADNQRRRTEVQILGSKFSEKVSFIDPEILEIGEENLRAFLDELAALEPYRHDIEDTLRQSKHVLDADAEAMMAATSLIRSTPSNTYRTLANADMPWPTITLSTGEEVRLDQSAYTKYRSVDVRSDRQAVFETFWGKWKEFERTMGTTLAGQVNAHIFTQRQRGYPNSLTASLDNNAIPEAVYRTLISETNNNLDTLHRYFRLRGRMLGVEDLRYFDIYPSLVEADLDFSIESGKQLTLEAVAPLGSAYTEVMSSGFDSRWMDVYPRPGKRSGAYMNGSAYDVHPYVLMNYNEDYESVSTLAHEWGHAMHSYLANKNQPYPTARYSIFTAEIASTFNEALLLDHMLKQARNDDERLYYLGSALEGLRGTYFRQTMFAEFELAIHDRAEAGEALTGAKFTEIYADLLRRYHGHDAGVLTIDDLYTVEWAYIPHFYYNFYVYQYATSLAASSLFAEAVLQGRPGAVENYMKLLKAGGSDYPYELLNQAGVDMATPAPYQAVFTRMNAIMDQIEGILDQREAHTAP